MVCSFRLPDTVLFFSDAIYSACIGSRQMLLPVSLAEPQLVAAAANAAILAATALRRTAIKFVEEE